MLVLVVFFVKHVGFGWRFLVLRTSGDLFVLILDGFVREVCVFF